MAPALRCFVGVLAALFLSGAAVAALPTWSTRFNGASQNAPADPPSFPQGGSQFGGSLGSRSMAVDALGNIYVAGSVIVDPLHGEDFLVEKYDIAGKLVWYRTLDGGSRFRDTATGLALSADAVYVTGESCKTGGSPCSSDFLTVKYDAASGTLAWAKLADGPAANRDFGPRIAVDNLGTPFVAGTTLQGAPNNSTDFLTIRYNLSTGVEAWRRIASTGTGQSQDVVGALGVGPDGHVVVSGSGDQTLGGLASLLTVKYDGPSGTPLWTHNATSIQNVYPYALVIDAASNPIVVGETDKFGDSRFLTLKYVGGNGALFWMNHVNYSPLGGDDAAHDVALDGAGNVYVTGRAARPNFGGYSFHTVKYAVNSGTELWAHGFGVGGADDDYVPTGITYNSVGDRVIVAGYYQNPSGERNYVVESLDPANGNVAPLQVTTDILPYDLAVDVATGGSTVIIAGGSSSPAVRDLMLVKYNSALTEIWRVADPPLETQEILGGLATAQFGHRKIAIDALGSTVVVGSTAATVHQPSDFLIRKYGPGGDLRWSRTIDGGIGGGGGSGADLATSVVIGGANGVSDIYVTGWSVGLGTDYDVVTMRLNASDGSTVWSKRYDSPAHQADVSYGIALGTQRVFVGGASAGGGQYETLLLGYPLADGNSPWVATLDFPGGSAVYALTAGCRDNLFNQCTETVYIAGVAIDATAPGSGNEFMTALFDAGTGGLVSGLTQGGGGDAVGMAIAAFGNPSTVVATGRRGADWMTTAFQGSSATPLWTMVRDFEGNDDRAFDVAFDSSGRAFVAGVATRIPDGNLQAATIKYDTANGNELASSLFGVVDDDATAYGVATDFAGNVYLGGKRSARANGRGDLLFLKYTNDLILITGGFVDSQNSDDQGSALAVEKVSGDAVVAGTSFATAAAGDLLLAKFRAFERGRFFTTTPCRLYDSRQDSRGPLGGGETRILSALGFVNTCSWLTPAVKSLAINVTAVGSTASGYLQLWAGNEPPPSTSVSNFAGGQTRANNATLNLATNAAGTFAIYSGQAPGQAVHVIVDLNGYFD